MWSVTINNPTDADLEQIAMARQRGWEVLGQLEKGVEGTSHYQLAVKTPQVRFSAVKKQFPRAHIEVAKSRAALLKYVIKEETRAGELPNTTDKYPSLSRFWDLVFEHLNGLGKDGLDYVELDSGVVCMYRRELNEVLKKNPLHFLDAATAALIERGYHVEGIGANPNTRSQWKLYHKQLILRSYAGLKSLAERIQNADDNEDEVRSGTTSELQETRGLEDEEASYFQTGSEGSESHSEGSGETRE